MTSKSGRIACQVPFCRRTAPDRGQTEVICGRHWRTADKALTRRYKALYRWIERNKDNQAPEALPILRRRWYAAERAWKRIKQQAIERAMGIG